MGHDLPRHEWTRLIDAIVSNAERAADPSAERRVAVPQA